MNYDLHKINSDHAYMVMALGAKIFEKDHSLRVLPEKNVLENKQANHRINRQFWQSAVDSQGDVLEWEILK